MRTVLRGIIVTPIPNFQWKWWQDGVCVVHGETIEFVGETVAYQQRYGQPPPEHPRFLLLPGFIDLHTHLPQYPVRGMGEGTLLEWLEKWIFPAETAFQDAAYAYEVAKAFFQDLLAHGTTAAVVFGPPYEAATDAAFTAAKEAGIRLWMGMTVMDRYVPEALRRSPEILEMEMQRLVQRWHRPEERMQYVITPRFAPSCSPPLLHRCAAVANRWELMVQTHLAENPAEIAWVAELFPDQPHYTGVYHHFGLLHSRTILAHCIHLSPAEQAIIRQKEAVIAHCPTSNRFLQSGIMPLRRYLDQQLRVGLGTDVAAGYQTALLYEAREAVEQSKTLALCKPDEKGTVDPATALWLATRGGAVALSMEHRIGTIEPGLEADIVCFSFPSQWQVQSLPQLLPLLLYRYEELTVAKVYVAGRLRYSGTP